MLSEMIIQALTILSNSIVVICKVRLIYTHALKYTLGGTTE